MYAERYATSSGWRTGRRTDERTVTDTGETDERTVTDTGETDERTVTDTGETDERTVTDTGLLAATYLAVGAMTDGALNAVLEAEQHDWYHSSARPDYNCPHCREAGWAK